MADSEWKTLQNIWLVLRKLKDRNHGKTCKQFMSLSIREVYGTSDSYQIFSSFRITDIPGRSNSAYVYFN